MTTAIAVLLLTVWIAHGTGTEVNNTITTSGLSRNCHDLLYEGKVYEGHFIVYPEVTNHPSMIYCSQDDGMEAWTSEMADQQSARNCMDLLQDGMTNSGPNIIYPHLEQPTIPVLVFCDQETDGGGWTVIQRRYDGTEEFYRPWLEYAEGFGNVDLEHYLGNDNIAAITGQGVNELKVELEDWSGVKAFAHYQFFLVGNASTQYKVQIGLYDGDAGDSLFIHGGMLFSTYDADHDVWDTVNCSENRHGGWWYEECTDSNLNGRYYPSAEITEGTKDGLTWYKFRGSAFSLKSTKMMIRGNSDANTNIGRHQHFYK